MCDRFRKKSSFIYRVHTIKGGKAVSYRFKNPIPEFTIGEYSGIFRPAGNPRGAQNQRLDFEDATKHEMTVERLVDGTVNAVFNIVVNVTDVTGQ